MALASLLMLQQLGIDGYLYRLCSLVNKNLHATAGQIATIHRIKTSMPKRQASAAGPKAASSKRARKPEDESNPYPDWNRPSADECQVLVVASFCSRQAQAGSAEHSTATSP